MAFVRDHGTCCLVLPLKLGVGISAMLVWAHAMVCILALLTSDIRFQATGYNTHFYYLPSIVGTFGLVFGFIGLLGVYDDKFEQLWWFNRYFFIKLVLMFVAVLADFATLNGCEGWKNNPNADSNAQLLALSTAGVCPWARWSYLVGCGVDFCVWGYLFVCCYKYEQDISMNPPYAIDFGREKYDVTSRWEFYKVKDPRKDKPPQESMPVVDEEDPFAFYGAMQEEQAEGQRYGPDGVRIRNSQVAYGPDGMPVSPSSEGPG